MFVVGSFNRTYVLKVGKGSLQMSNPIPIAFCTVLLQAMDNPGQIGTIRLKATDLTRWTRSANQQAIKDKLLEALAEQTLQPG